ISWATFSTARSRTWTPARASPARKGSHARRRKRWRARKPRAISRRPAGSRRHDRGAASSMPAVTPGLATIIFIAGTVAGALGALLGLRGGFFLVPFLNLGFNFPITGAAAISLTTVIATSSSVSAARSGKQLINLRLGVALVGATGRVRPP